MPRKKASHDGSILQMALVGYEMEKQKIEEAIADIKSRLHGKSFPVSSSPAVKKVASTPTDGRKRTMSAAARRRMALGQKRRWAEYRKGLAAGQS